MGKNQNYGFELTFYYKELLPLLPFKAFLLQISLHFLLELLLGQIPSYAIS